MRSFALIPFLLGLSVSVDVKSGSVCFNDICFSTVLPSTTLTSLVAAQQTQFNLSSTSPPSSDPVEQIYWKDNLSLLPDASDGFNYTAVWRPNFEDIDAPVKLLKLHGCGYTCTVRSGDTVLLRDSGFWRSRLVDVSDFNLSTLTITTSPPPFPGLVTSRCPVDPPPGSPNCGQGGDHVLARNAGAMQFAAGWDWAQGIPDRVSGLFSRVEVISSHPVRVSDGALRTKDVEEGIVDVVYSLNGIDGAEEVEGNAKLRIEFKGEVVVEVESELLSVSEGSREFAFTGVSIPSVELWWPFTMGASPLYTLTVSFLGSAYTWRAGVRKVETYIDSRTRGRGFKVNGEKFFIQGGNWIATDAMLQRGGRERYEDEVMMHKFNGLNLIRVWGGGLPERDEFYSACDEMGVMVMQEFWMSGDNNGRWGGEYDYPDDKEAYLEMVEDTVLRLRGFTSLLFWGGGNELWPAGQSPPPVIRAGLESLVDSLDDRFLIMSSMDGGYDGLNMTLHDDSFALAVKDGPYGFLDFKQYYTENNPGMVNGSEVIVSFQPEVGGSSMTTMEGLGRMGLDAGGGFPGWRDEGVPPLWDYHKFQGYSYTGLDGEDRDAIWDYGEPGDLQGYVDRAWAACLQQYQALFEGFTMKMFGDYREGGKTAIIMWKSQTPWPSLRGFMYDWWMETVGMGEGVRAGTGGEGRWKVGLDLGKGGGVTVVNRGVEEVGAGAVEVKAFGWGGDEVGEGVRVEVGRVKGGEVVKVGGGVVAEWAEGLEGKGTVLVRVRGEVEGGARAESWYWLNRVGGEWEMRFEDMGSWSEGGEVEGRLEEVEEGRVGDWWYGKMVFKVNRGRGCLVNPRFKGYDGNGERVLPLMVGSGLVALNDGEDVEWEVRARREIVRLEVVGWGGGGGSVERRYTIESYA